MKKLTRFLFVVALFSCGFTFAMQKTKKVEVTEAATQTPGFPSGGNAGSIVFISGGGTYFNDVDAVLYCSNSYTGAFSAKSSYRIPGTDTIAVRIPSGGGWTHFEVLRYNRAKEPSIDGWDGVYNRSPKYGFSETFMQKQNTFSIVNWNMEISSRWFTDYTSYGAQTNDQFYLDLSSFQSWEDGNAQFALYFADPMLSNGDAWSSMMTKVEGSGNDHLYECVVPGTVGVWNLVIPVRFNPNVEIPGWHDGVWDQTNDIRFNSTNHTHNVVKVTDWKTGELKDETITRTQRVEMYGQHFLDTVACSGTGNSDVTTSEQWESVKSQYQNMHTDYQGDVWTTVANKDPEATKVAQAMARYDYIVLFKHYNHEDFINRAGSPNKTEYAASPISVRNNIENNNTALLIAIVSSVSLISVSILIVVKKTRTRGNN